MGVERNLIDVKLNKSNSLDLYRPPALRNNVSESSSRMLACNATETFHDIHSSSVTSESLATSISCNNSPIHRKTNTNGIVDIATSTQQNGFDSNPQKHHQQQQSQEAADETCKPPQRQQQQSRRERRPDRAVYIPRARRSQTTPPTTTPTQQAPPPPVVPVVMPSISAQVPREANGNTAAATTITTANHTSKSLNQNQQLAITLADTTAASVTDKPSSKTDEVGKTAGLNSAATKKREKPSKETRERREHRASKKLLSAQPQIIQPNNDSKNSVKSNENVKNINSKTSDDELPSQTVVVIAQREKTPPPPAQSSIADVNSINSSSEQTNSSVGKLSDCDTEEQEDDLIINKSDGIESNRESLVLKKCLNYNQNDNFVINEFVETQLLSVPTDTVSKNFANISNSLTNITNDITTMPKPNKHKNNSNKTSNAVDNAKMPNLRIEDVAATKTPKCDIEEQELQRASKEINRSNRRIMKQTFVSDVLQIPDHIAEDDDELKTKTISTAAKKTVTTPKKQLAESNSEEDDEEDDWEKMYDENGECLDPKIMQELTASVGKCKIELPKMDYSAFLTKQSILNDEEFPHVLEVSNFPVEFKNQDLLMIFSQYKESGFDIKWVDDTHALAVFSSSRIAAEVLTMGHPFVVLKPLAEATLESRVKAKKCAASLQPYRPRPETCAALARRLVTGALGVRLKTAAAERENEKRVLREAKERKLLAAKQRDEAWES
ncbi:ras guanine nucleotide exchange factor P isoform X2 [Musca domestica]|nr:ras guanine nucleotide exchange factor P isoform X2 [Musca domestica]